MALKKQILSLLLISICVCVAENSKEKLKSEALGRCLKMADPLMHNSDYIFPLTTEAIRDLCKIWDGFVMCIREYTVTYLTLAQQSNFEAAINPILQSSMPLCREDLNYQKVYLSFAPCMKRVALEPQYCGNHYHYMIDLLKGEGFKETPQMCCAYHKFRECFMDKSHECDNVVGTASGQNTASEAMRSLLDRAFRVLEQKCTNYIPNAHDCLLDSNSLVDGNTGTSSLTATDSDGGVGEITDNGIGVDKATDKGTISQPGTS